VEQIAAEGDRGSDGASAVDAAELLEKTCSVFDYEGWRADAGQMIVEPYTSIGRWRVADGASVRAAFDGPVLESLLRPNGDLAVYQQSADGRWVAVYSGSGGFAARVEKGAVLSCGASLGAAGQAAGSSRPEFRFQLLRVEDGAEWWRGQPVDPRPLVR
jgi:hypothetical protein